MHPFSVPPVHVPNQWIWWVSKSSPVFLHRLWGFFLLVLLKSPPGPKVDVHHVCTYIFLYITYYKYNYRRISTPPPKKKMKGLGVSPKLISCWIDSMLVGFSVFHVGIFRFRVGVFGALFFQVTLFVGFKWPFHRLHDLQLGDQKKHLKKTWFLKNHPSHQAFVCWQGTHTNSNIACDWMRFQPSLQHTTHQL